MESEKEKYEELASEIEDDMIYDTEEVVPNLTGDVDKGFIVHKDVVKQIMNDLVEREDISSPASIEQAPAPAPMMEQDPPEQIPVPEKHDVAAVRHVLPVKGNATTRPVIAGRDVKGSITPEVRPTKSIPGERSGVFNPREGDEVNNMKRTTLHNGHKARTV